ncbi:MAG TPA: CDP-alcohol phosphatidyltransferase family protein [Candidatus Binataceae bacterium]|nr:CDP-alcohol phosphatidyltransferase family protein [Candidatus Binataceae bacterium]
MTSKAPLVRAQATAGGVALSRKLLNLPNFLTFCRILAIPFFLALLEKRRLEAALILFLAAALTDGLDGTLARWGGSRTELGAFLDPFADKLLLLSSFVVLAIERLIPGWLLGAVVLRDVVVVFGYLMVAFFIGERIPVRPSYAGKICTVLELGCIVAALLEWPLSAHHRVPWHVLIYATVCMTALSGLQYVYRGLSILNSREPQMFS